MERGVGLHVFVSVCCTRTLVSSFCVNLLLIAAPSAASMPEALLSGSVAVVVVAVSVSVRVG